MAHSQLNVTVCLHLRLHHTAYLLAAVVKRRPRPVLHDHGPSTRVLVLTAMGFMETFDLVGCSHCRGAGSGWSTRFYCSGGVGNEGIVGCSHGGGAESGKRVERRLGEVYSQAVMSPRCSGCVPTATTALNVRPLIHWCSHMLGSMPPTALPRPASLSHTSW